MSLNLLPLLAKVKIQLDAWRNLPLSLIGKVNLLKIKILPVFLYFLRNYPIWVPCSFFRRVNSLFGSFLWSTAHPRISLCTPQEPLVQGGLALPNLFKYFIVGQMVARRWLLRDDGDAATVLEAALMASYESLYYLVCRGSQASSSLTGSIRVTVRAWDRAQVLIKSANGVWSPGTPLWFNPRLHHLGAIPDPII